MVNSTMKPLYTVTRRSLKDKHLYSIEGEPAYQDMKSVTYYTGIIDKSGALMNWAVREALANVRRELAKKVGTTIELDAPWIDDMVDVAKEKPERIKTDAGDYGTMMHQAIDVFIAKGKWPAYDPAIQPAIDSFLLWWGKGRNIIMGDTYVASKIHRYGGAFDCIEDRDDGIYLLDWKSSNAIWPEMAVQVAGGYGIAFEETFGFRAAGASILRFGKHEPEFEARDIIMEPAQNAFFHSRYLREAMGQKLFVPVIKEKKKSAVSK